MTKLKFHESVDTGLLRLVVVSTNGGFMARVMLTEREGGGSHTLTLTPQDAATMGAMLLRATPGIAPLEPDENGD